ncbi:MAG: hypothetical protein ABI867_21430 [Kofleriaceae bacterium]
MGARDVHISTTGREIDMPQTPDKSQPKKSEQHRGDRELDLEDDERTRMADEGGPDPEERDEPPDQDEEDDEQDRITQRSPSVRDPDDSVSKH